MKSVTSVEYVPIRHVIRFIAYRMNWSIVRVAEWLLARDFEQYISAYKEGEDSKYYEINNINDIDDIATSYLLKRTLDIGHGAICTEGEKEENKYFYKAYYKMDDINNHHILNRLELDFNEIYSFSYDTDAKGFVKAINHKLLDITDVLIIPTPSVTPTKSDPYEQYLVELEQLKIDEARNKAKAERWQNQQLNGTYKEFVETTKDVINLLEHTIEQQEQDIKKLNNQLKEQADKPTDKHLYDWQAMNQYNYPPELHLAILIWEKSYILNEISNRHITDHSQRFKIIGEKIGLDKAIHGGALISRLSKITNPQINKQKGDIENLKIIKELNIKDLDNSNPQG